MASATSATPHRACSSPCCTQRFFQLIAAQNHLLAWGAFGGPVHFTIGGIMVAVAFPVVDPSAAAAGPTGVGFAYARYGRRDVLTFLGGHWSAPGSPDGFGEW